MQIKHNRQGHYTLICLLSIFISLLGLSVIYGWHTQNIKLIQISLTFAPMQYNTALGFLLCGISLPLTLLKKQTVSKVISISIILLGLVTLSQYLFSMNIGLDELFMLHDITTKTSHPGRMAPNTALCFILSGSSLLIFNFKLAKYKHSLISAMLGSLVFGLGVIALTGYALNLETAYGWGELTRMAVHTSIGFIFLGIIVISYTWLISEKTTSLPLWVPIPMGLGVTTIIVSLWQAINTNNNTLMANNSSSQYFPFINNLFLIIGILMAISFSVAIHHALTSRLREKEAKALNEKLKFEIIERKKTEESLITQSQIVTNMTEGAYLIRVSDGIILYSNPAFEKMFGYEQGEMIGKHVSIVNAPTDASPVEVFLEIEKLIKQTGSWKGEVLNIRKNGSTFWNSASVTTFNHEIHGDVWVSVHTDITKNKIMKDALKENENNLIRAQEISETGNWKLNTETRIIEGSTEFFKIFEIEPTELKLESLLELTHPNDKELTLKNIKEGMKLGTPWSHEYRVLLKDGVIKWVKGVGEPIKNENGEVISIEGVVQNITKSKSQEEIIRRSQKMDALGKITGGIAHDYNNMLGIILGYTELLSTSIAKQSKESKHLECIIHASNRASQLTSKLLSFSRKKHLNLSNVNINDLLQEQRDLLEKTLTANIPIQFDLKYDIWPIYIDAGEFEDAILNMSINAMHAMNNVGKLIIKTDNINLTKHEQKLKKLKQQDFVTVSLIDNGLGMSQKTKDKIFEPFFSTKGELGTGLGMSQVYGFVKRNQGTIEIFSTIDVGTEIILYLPRNTEKSKNHLQQSKLESNKHIGKESILVVDDEVALLELTCEILKQYDYNVYSAKSALEALTVLKTQSIDLLLTDVIMSEMNGYELVKVVSDKYPSIKIQMASGYNDELYNKNIDPNLLENLLQKPFTRDKLLQVVGIALSK